MTTITPLPAPPRLGQSVAATPPALDDIRWFASLGRNDTPIAGGKGANLGEMTRAGLPVPPGFVVTVEAYRRFYEASGLAAEITSRIRSLDIDNPDRLRAGANALRWMIRQAPVPDDIRAAIVEAYDSLTTAEAGSHGFVSVRSSATVEDSDSFSFAGMFESFLNVRGADVLVMRVKDCWASAFGARVLYYRLKQGLPAEFPLAVVVQRMVQSEKSGVMFTVNPATSDRNQLVIEAIWGLGEAIVGGQVTPDRYVIDRATLGIIEVAIARKEFMLARDAKSGESIRVPLDAARAAARVLDEGEVGRLAVLGLSDEEHYGTPQDIEFAIEGSDVYIVQTRPVTTLIVREQRADAPAPPTVLVHGLGASPGQASGVVRVLASPEDDARLREGEVLVTQMTSPDWVPIMRRAAAIVTDAGGMTSHAAIVSRELGIPCIVGSRDGTTRLRDGMLVTVNAREGTVVEGAAVPTANTDATGGRATETGGSSGSQPLVTATRLYVNLGEPDLAESVAKRDVDGVGLLRAEFLLLSALEGTHPRTFLRDGHADELVKRLAEKLTVFAAAFDPRPVVYRAMDFRSNEFRGLRGGAEFEPEESNPMIGYRGCYRYTREADLFGLELNAIARVRERHPNLHLMIPFVRTGWEFRECKRLIDASPLGHDRNLQFWVMAEVPSVVTWLEEYARLGVSGVSIGSNDLTQLVLGVDRDSEVLAPLYDERDPAVLDVIRRIVSECGRLGLSCSICGQAPSVHPDYAELLVRWGIDSISVNPDVIETTRRHIAAAEQRILLERARANDSCSGRTHGGLSFEGYGLLDARTLKREGEDSNGARSNAGRAHT